MPYERPALVPGESPIQSILHIVEIVEDILRHVPLEDLVLNVPRVCKAFHEITKTSPTIKKVLWQIPEGLPNIWTLDRGFRPLTGTEAEQYIANEVATTGETPTSRSLAVVNPLLLEPKRLCTAYIDSTYELPVFFKRWKKAWCNIAKEKMSATSCRNMQVSQPPAKVIILVIKGVIPDPDYGLFEMPTIYNTQTYTVKNDNGVTIDELADAITAHEYVSYDE